MVVNSVEDRQSLASGGFDKWFIYGVGNIRHTINETFWLDEADDVVARGGSAKSYV